MRVNGVGEADRLNRSVGESKRANSGLGRERACPEPESQRVRWLLASPAQGDGRPAAQRARHLLATDAQERCTSAAVLQADGISLDGAGHGPVVVDSGARKRPGDIVASLL